MSQKFSKYIYKCNSCTFFLQNQWNTNGGKCGLCGDQYQGPRESEAGGKFATEVIVRRFWEGQTINITVKLTSAHKGWYEFKLCKNDNPRKNFTQECLDENALKVSHCSLH